MKKKKESLEQAFERLAQQLDHKIELTDGRVKVATEFPKLENALPVVRSIGGYFTLRCRKLVVIEYSYLDEDGKLRKSEYGQLPKKKAPRKKKTGKQSK